LFADAARHLLCGRRNRSANRAGVRADAGAAAGDAVSRAMASAAWLGGTRAHRDAVWRLNWLGHGVVGTCLDLGAKAARRHTKIAGAAQFPQRAGSCTPKIGHA